MTRQTLILLLVAVSVGLSWYLASQGSTGPKPRSQCLTHGDCQSTERCIVAPKGDGFASFGQCGEQCVGDDGCPNGWTCRAWVDEKGYLAPERGQVQELPRVKACAHHLVK